MRLLGRWSGRVLAVAVAVVLTLPCAAFAWSLGEDLAIGVAMLPVDHPCRSGVEVRWVPGLRVAGRPAAGASATGRRGPDGQWEPMRCETLLEPSEYARFSACERRRLVVHEVMRLGGHVTGEGGIMAVSPGAREGVAVPDCPAVREGALDRATALVLARVPTGWDVSCGWARRRGVIGCSAMRGRSVRRYRVLVRGSRLVVRRVAG